MQLFLSHAWGPDEEGRDACARVVSLAGALRRRGWPVWLDSERLHGNLDAAMAHGIDTCDAVLLCLTRHYCRKVNAAAASARSTDNCYKEFAYAMARGKRVLPILLDASLRNPGAWSPGVVPMRIGGLVYVDASDVDAGVAACRIATQLRRSGLRSGLRTRQRLLSRRPPPTAIYI